MNETSSGGTSERVSAIVHSIAAIAAAQMQADWTGMSALLDGVSPEDIPLYGNVTAELLAQCAHWEVNSLEDGGQFDSIERPLRAAAIAISEGKFDRANILARGRTTPSEAAWAMCLAWNAQEGDPGRALEKAQAICRAAASGVRLVATYA